MMNRIVVHPHLSKALRSAAASIFGELPPSTTRTNNKDLRHRPFVRDLLCGSQEFYDKKQSNLHGMFRKHMTGFETQENLDRLERVKTLRESGRGPPKKGQSKRKARK